METRIEDFPTLLGLSGTHEVLGLAGITEADKQQYVTTNYPTAKIVGTKFNLNPVVILAQGAMESGWGTSYMARNIFNFFGVTASGATNDYWKGDFYVSKTSGLKFRKYANAQDGFSDFARLITSRYKTQAAESYSIPDYARDIANSAYISEKNGDNREIYRKGIINNAVYILKAIGAADQSAKLAATAKTQQPITNSAPAPTAPAPKTDTRETNEAGMGGALGLALAGLLVFGITMNSKTKK